MLLNHFKACIFPLVRSSYHPELFVDPIQVVFTDFANMVFGWVDQSALYAAREPGLVVLDGYEGGTVGGGIYAVFNAVGASYLCRLLGHCCD